MKRLLQFFKHGFCPIILTVFLGCLPDPHRTLRSPAVKGRVLDAQTLAAVEGAEVFFTDHPEIASRTDREGNFLIKPTYNLHWESVPPEGNWPERKYWEDRVTVSHPGYLATRIDHWPSDKGADKGDILLERAK